MAIKRNSVVATPGGPLARPDDKDLARYPVILEWMTETSFEDGTPREVSTLAVSIKDGRVQLALNDKEERRSVYTSARTLSEALRALDKALGEGTCEWRLWDNPRRAKK